MTRIPDNGSVTYVVRVATRLPARREAWFDGFEITHEPDGTTSLTGPVVDQAELHGLLAKIRDLNLTLLSVSPTAGP